jgi:NADH:ubiquinone oxidoreductase subunit 4 (subunit M)
VNAGLLDIDGRERTALWPTAVAALVMGVAPLLWLNSIEPSIHSMLVPFTQVASKVVGQ